MNFPKNGRIAIIDDQISQAEPLIKVFSKKQMPLTYFSGEVEFLPEEGDNLNDIRVLFLDINLIDNSEYDNKVLKGRLIPVLKRVISEENYPYVLIYWTRHEHHKDLIEKEIFNEDLASRKPIAYLSATKSDFFQMNGEPTDEFDSKLEKLFGEINELLNEHHAYSYLNNWENQIHFSAAETLQNIFGSINDREWDVNANNTLNKLSEAYLGKHYENAKNDEKIKGSFISLSTVFKDILEHSLQNQNIENAVSLDNTENTVLECVNSLNLSLNTVRHIKDIAEPGNVLEFKEGHVEDIFKDMLNRLISFFCIRDSIKLNEQGISNNQLKNKAKTKRKEIIVDIENRFKKIGIVVTPVCDFAQKKNIFNRIIYGLLIPEKYKDAVESKSEAVFTIPFVIEMDEKYILVIDFRYFTTTKLAEEEVNGLFRIRQELLSEIQSRLSRHINRQGILVVK